jgi:hypothetical protein
MKRNFVKGPLALLLGIIVNGTVTGLGLAGCKDDKASSPPSGVPEELVAIWYVDANSNGEVDAGEDSIAAYEFKSDGSLLVAGVSGYSVSVSGDKITLIIAGVAMTEPITYTVEGKKLTLSGNPTSGFAAGTYAKK